MASEKNISKKSTASTAASVKASSTRASSTKTSSKKATKAYRTYKDRLFKALFGNPAHKAWTLSLYNAVNNSNYTDPTAIKFNTVENTLFLGIHNDVSFLIAFEMVFWEHQSTFNPNEPLRILRHYAQALEKHIAITKDFNLYSSTLQRLPRPKFVCFYNGTQDQPDKIVLKLSDAFANTSSDESDGSEGSKRSEGSKNNNSECKESEKLEKLEKPEDYDVEVKVTMLNINYGKNKELMEACKPLKEYTWLVETVRQRQSEKKNLEAAIDAAIDEMPRDFVIRNYIIGHRAEVKKMFISEWTEQEMLQRDRNEAHNKGLMEGRAEERRDLLARLQENGMLTAEQAQTVMGWNF